MQLNELSELVLLVNLSSVFALKTKDRKTTKVVVRNTILVYL